MSDNQVADLATEPQRRISGPLKPFEVFWDDKSSGVTLDSPEVPKRSIWVARDWPVCFRAWDFKVINTLPDLQISGGPRLVVEARSEIVEGGVAVIGTPLRTRNFHLQLRGFDPSKATTKVDGGDTSESLRPQEPKHPIDAAVTKSYRAQFEGREHTAALGFNTADEDDRYGPEDPETWWAQFDVPYGSLETLITAIRTGQCRELILGGQFVNLYCDEFATRGDFISWGLLPSRDSSSAADAHEHWVGDPKGGYPQAYGTLTGIRWDEHYPSPTITPAPEPTQPPPQSLEIRSPEELVVIVRWLPRIFWALVAIAVAIMGFA